MSRLMGGWYKPSMLWLTMFTLSSGSCSLELIGAPTTILSVTPITVEALYSNAADWNQWVENNGSTELTADNTACNADSIIDGGINNGSYQGYEACVHGGIHRQVALPEESSCEGLSITDNLSLFNWSCDQSNGVRFISTGFKGSKKLADLLNADSWKENYVTVKRNGKVLVSSEPAVWWNNPVYDLNGFTPALGVIPNYPISGMDNGVSGTLDVLRLEGGNAIYTISSNQSSLGYNINADNVTLVIFPGATLSRDALGNANVDALGEIGTVDRVMVASGSQNYLWLEGDIDGTNFSRAVGIANGKFHNYQNLNLLNTSNDAFNGIGLENSRFFNISTAHSAQSGFIIAPAYWNFFKKIQSYDNAQRGIYIGFGHNNRMHEIRSAHAVALYAFEMGNCAACVAYDVMVSQSAAGGIAISGLAHAGNTAVNLAGLNGLANIGILGTGNTVSHMTTMNTSSAGAVIFGGDNNTVNQLLSLNAGDNSLSLTLDANNNLLSQIVAARSQLADIFVGGASDNNIFTHNLMVGNSGVNLGCFDDGSTTGNNVTTAIDCGGDDPAHNMTVANSAIDSKPAFADVITDDATNDHANFTMTIGAITDWFNFDNPLRIWGINANQPLVDINNRGTCTTDCGIFDFSLLNTDTEILSRSGNGLSANQAFTNGAPCPDAVDGDYTVVEVNGVEISGDGIGNDDGTCNPLERCRYEIYGHGGNNDGICDAGEVCRDNRIFLANAVERMEDGIGNDDGLCESSESCIYSPNFGLYQGHGGINESANCTFSDGTGTFPVSDVKLYQYNSNGR